MEKVRKLSMCRICLVENVRMFLVGDKNLQDTYEQLTGIPFVTEDSKPTLACFFCCTKLKQCWRFQRKCLEADELLTRILNEDYVHNQAPLYGGFIITPVDTISIIHDFEIECEAIKQELVDLTEDPLDIEVKVEHVTDDFENREIDYSEDQDDMPLNNPESIDEDDLALIAIRGEKQEVPKKKQNVNSRENFENREIDYSKDQDDMPLNNPESDDEDDLPLIAIRGEKQEVPKKKQNVNSRKKNKKNETSDQNLLQTTAENSETGALACDVDQRNEALNKKNVKRQRKNCKKKELMRKIGKNKADTISSVNHLVDDGKKSFICDICSKGFTNKNYLKQHILIIHAGHRPYKCDICGKCFPRRSSLTLHINLHTGRKPYKCDKCHKSFPSQKYRKLHSWVHNDESPYKCDVCQLGYRTQSGLKYHSQRHTGGPEKLSCDICQKSFNLKSHLKGHLRLHTGEKPYKCDICERRFHTKTHLNTHFQTHTGLKPFKCDVCQKSYASRSQFNAHCRTHTGVKPHKCDLCELRFVNRSSLKAHVGTHTGEKPYSCEFCQQNFKLKKYLNRHVSKRHANQKAL